MQINLTGFLGAKNARLFMAELWRHLVSASSNALGISQYLIDEEKVKAAAHQVRSEHGGGYAAHVLHVCCIPQHVAAVTLWYYDESFATSVNMRALPSHS
jgi:hypothetical protein